jgi:hypothetical protein
VPGFTVPGSAVPGAAVPGVMTPGLPEPLAIFWEYTGLTAGLYLQYLGPGGTLSVTPGQEIRQDLITVASGWPYPLPVPPGDGRWTDPPQPAELLEDHRVALARARAHNAGLQAAALAGAGRLPAPPPAGNPAPAVLPAAPPGPSPALARARAHSARRHALIAAGSIQPGEPS